MSGDAFGSPWEGVLRGGGDEAKVAIVGAPNVGKSVLFTALARQYVVASNYPGTTVEVSRGHAQWDGRQIEIIDTPGMYSLWPVTEEERIGRRILLVEHPDLVIHVVDARNLERMLPMTLQLIEVGVPCILALNIMDEAEEEGIRIDVPALAERLGIRVVPTVSTKGEGIPTLKRAIAAELDHRPPSDETPRVVYGQSIEKAIAAVMSALNGVRRSWTFSHRAMALFLLGGDADITKALQDDLGPAGAAIACAVARHSKDLPQPLNYHVAVALRNRSRAIAEEVVTTAETAPGFKEKLSRLMMRPLTGFPILFLVLYLGLYKFVGGFGAGTIVNFLEGKVFDGYINPAIGAMVDRAIPWAPIRDLLAGEYGVLTLGLRYAVALVLPIVAVFFIVFAVIEDTGYLPRLAMLIDRTFKKIGLSGRAVIPMVLGLGCDTMATMVTRTLPTER